jgi:hypothetical protein
VNLVLPLSIRVVILGFGQMFQRVREANRLVHTATSQQGIADNFRTQSNKYHGGVFITGLLEYRRRMVTELYRNLSPRKRRELGIGYRQSTHPNRIPPAPISAVSPFSFWNQRFSGFIPFHHVSPLGQLHPYWVTLSLHISKTSLEV